jgi:biopolymer transport protein ExbB
MTDAFDFLAKGGWFMVPIAACSIFGLAFFLERIWHLRRERILPPRFLDVVSRLLEQRSFAKAESLCHANDSPVAAILTDALRYRGRSRDLIKEVMEETGRREIYFLERFTGVLGAIATVSPLLGLLGTVVGMIRMFQQVVADAGAGSVDVGLLATGIWQALITTAAGLVVAIPVFLGYRYVLGRIDRYAVEMEDIGLRALDYLVAPDEAPTSAADASPSVEEALDGEVESSNEDAQRNDERDGDALESSRRTGDEEE